MNSGKIACSGLPIFFVWRIKLRIEEDVKLDFNDVLSVLKDPLWFAEKTQN